MGEKVIELVHLQKQFGDHTVLRDIHLSVEKGEVLSIIGASGSGKSTMLRCINLLETPTSGQVLYHGQDITAREMNLSQYRAKVGMVFQSFNLFNNMTALQNCVTGQMSVLRRSRAEAEKIAMEYLGRVGMTPYIHARPAQKLPQAVRVITMPARDNGNVIALSDADFLDCRRKQITYNLLCFRKARMVGKGRSVVRHDQFKTEIGRIAAKRLRDRAADADLLQRSRDSKRTGSSCRRKSTAAIWYRL